MHIFLSITDRANREHLQAQLSESSSYDLSTGENPLHSDENIDLWILDEAAFERDPAAVQAVKTAKEPQYFPVLLVWPERTRSSLDPTVWEYVDDVVTVPVSPAVLEIRLKNLLRTRALSLQALSSHQRFDSLVRTTSSAIIFLTMDGTIEFANNAAESLFGYETHELVDHPITRLIPPRLQTAAKDGLENYECRIGNGHSGSTLESVGLYKNGHEIPIQLSYGWFELDGDYYFTGIIQELTAIKKRETRLQVLNRVLRHDIRNDMNVIRGYANLIAEGDPNSDQHIRTILSVVDDVVQLSKQARELDQLFEACQNAIQKIDICALAAAKSAEFEETYPDATIGTVFPDGMELSVQGINLFESVLDNLVENAIKHNDSATPEVTITVGHAADSDLISIDVADNGPGLPQNDVDVIETGTETPLEHASGLGLWLVNWIITESGGQIHFSENEPRGSRIRILLPSA